VENHTRVDLPDYVPDTFEVFLNGVPQVDGRDYQAMGRSLIFERPLATEGHLGFWRWARMLLGVAGTYRKNDAIDIVFSVDGRPKVITLRPATDPATPPTGPE